MSVDVQQVTSRGCSRAYIVCVLWHGWQYVRSLRSQGEPVCFPFPDDIVQLWLDSALIDCCTAPDFLHLFGGTEFQREDASSFWTTPLNFFTWWKNNVERKSKFGSLAKDALTVSDNVWDPHRSLYCKQIVALSANIRNHFDRIINRQDDDVVRQVDLPVSMPAHMVLCHQRAQSRTDERSDERAIGVVYSAMTIEEFIVSRFPAMARMYQRQHRGALLDPMDREFSRSKSNIPRRRAPKRKSSPKGSSPRRSFKAEGSSSSSEASSLSETSDSEHDEDEDHSSVGSESKHQNEIHSSRRRSPRIAAKRCFSSKETISTSKALPSDIDEERSRAKDKFTEKDIDDEFEQDRKRYCTRHSVRQNVPSAVEPPENHRNSGLCDYQPTPTLSVPVFSDTPLMSVHSAVENKSLPTTPAPTSPVPAPVDQKREIVPATEEHTPTKLKGARRFSLSVTPKSQSKSSKAPKPPSKPLQRPVPLGHRRSVSQTFDPCSQSFDFALFDDDEILGEMGQIVHHDSGMKGTQLEMEIQRQAVQSRHRCDFSSLTLASIRPPVPRHEQQAQRSRAASLMLNQHPLPWQFTQQHHLPLCPLMYQRQTELQPAQQTRLQQLCAPHEQHHLQVLYQHPPFQRQEEVHRVMLHETHLPSMETYGHHVLHYPPTFPAFSSATSVAGCPSSQYYYHYQSMPDVDTPISLATSSSSAPVTQTSACDISFDEEADDEDIDQEIVGETEKEEKRSVSGADINVCERISIMNSYPVPGSDERRGRYANSFAVTAPVRVVNQDEGSFDYHDYLGCFLPIREALDEFTV